MAALALLAPPLLAGAGGEDLDGAWDGSLDVLGSQLAIRVVFETREGALAARIDIPQQGAHGMPLHEVRAAGSAVHFELDGRAGRAVFDGRRDGDAIRGAFLQAGVRGDFALTRARDAASPGARPAAAAAGHDEEVRFRNGDVELAGTFSRPAGAGPHPALALLGGSGPQDRDADLFGMPFFRVLAEHLTWSGFAVLRWDDRGVGGSSGSTADSTTEDLAGDALAALAWLRARPEVARDRVGLLGHSEGGAVAALAAARGEAAFVVQLAGAAMRGDALLAAQAERLAEASGAGAEKTAELLAAQRQLFAAVRSGQGWEAIESAARQRTLEQIEALPAEQRAAIADPRAYADTLVRAELEQARSRWYRFFLDYDPAPALEKLRCPVLAVFGGRDWQVPAAPNEALMRRAFEAGGNRRVSFRTWPTANHLMREAPTGSPDEYAGLPPELVPGLLDELTAWLRAQTAAGAAPG
jgi:hypothetical protein